MTTIKDAYRVLASTSTGEYKEKGSKFLAYAYPIRHVSDVNECIEEVKSLHPKARHHCYAYRLGLDGDVYRMNDDGEPSGTAGKPIFGQLLSHEVSDALIIVVRYFGGTKLGASGLIQAYKLAAHEALACAETKIRTLTDPLNLDFDYAKMGHVLQVVKDLDLEIISKSFEVKPSLCIEIPKSKTAETLILLKAKLLEISTEQVNDETTIPFCNITLSSTFPHTQSHNE